jgi:NADPH-dependent glutamate synthase beta subunit-like oxidoreductase
VNPDVLKTYICSAIFLSVLWLLLTGSLDPQELIVGGVAVLAVVTLASGAVRSLKRYATERFDELKPVLAPATTDVGRGHSVAIVGGGPAGFTVA